MAGTKGMRLAFVIGTAAALAACGESGAGLTDSAHDPLAARVAALGFSTAGMRDLGDRVVVEGDIMLRKADLRDGIGQPAGPRKQYATTNRVGGDAAWNVQVNFSAVTSQSSAWSTAVSNAIQKWNHVPGARVWMNSTTSSANLTLDFAQCSTDPSVIACADFPTSGGSVGPTIHIDTDYKNQLSSSEKLFTIVHEMGHTLGFRHTNWNNRCPTSVCSEPSSPYGAVLIPGTPANTPGSADPDPGSVMMATVSGFTDFSYYDRVAARNLFPGGLGPGPWGSISSSHPVVTWPSMQDAVSYKVYAIESHYESDFLGFLYSVGTETYLTTTTGTSWTDTSRTVSSGPGYCVTPAQGYAIRAVFSDGSESGTGVGVCFS